MGRSPTIRLLAGLAITLSAVALYTGYTVAQLRHLEHLQADTIDRNRADSLLLLRIQNDLNSVALAMRDMTEGTEPYPLTAWKAQTAANPDGPRRRHGARDGALAGGRKPGAEGLSERLYRGNSGTPWTACSRWPPPDRRAKRGL